MQILRKIIDAITPNTKTIWADIQLRTDGFRTGDSTIIWSQVNKIYVYKRDMFTFDEVWFEFWCDNGSVVCVCEEQPGFEQLISNAISEFQILSDWQERIIKPAFATKYTVIYTRP